MTVSEHVSPDMLMYSGSRKRKARNPKYREKLNKRSTTALKSDGKEKDLGAESQTTQALPIKNLEEERKVKNITLQSPGRGADEVTSTDSHSKQTVPMGLCQLSLPDLLTTKRRLLIAACQNFSLCIEKLPPNLVKSLYASKKYDIPSHDMESSSDDSWDKRIVSVSLAQRRKRRERSTSESSGISMEIPLQNDEKSLIAGKTRARKAKLLIYSSDEETSVMETPQKKPKMSVADKLGLVSCNTKLFPSPSSPTRKRPIKRRLTMSSSSETEKAPALNGFVDSLTPPKRNTRSKKNRLSDKHGGVGNLVNKSQIKLNSETGQSSLENSSTLQPVKPVSKTSQSSLDTTSTLDSSPLGGKSWWPPHQMKKDKEGAESSQRFVTILDDASEKSIEKAHIPRKFYMSSLDSRKETAASILDSVTRSKQSKPDSKTGCSSLPDSSLSPSPELPLSIKSSTPLKTGYLSDKAVSQSPVLSKAPHLGSSSLKRRSTRIALLKSLSDSEAVSMEARADPYPLRNRSPKQPLKKSAVSSLKDFTSSPQMGSTVSVDVGKSVDKEVQTMIQTTQHSSKQNQSHVSHPGSSPSPENIAGTGTANRTSTQRRQALSNHTTTRGLISVSNKQNKQTITSTNKKSKKRPSLPSQAKVNKELKEGDSLSLEGGSEGVSVKSSEDHLYSPSTDHTTSSSLVSHSHKPLDAASDLSPESDRLPQVPQNEARTCRKRSGRKKRTITSTNKKSKKRPSLRSQAKVNKELKEGDSLSLEGGSEGVSVKLSEDHLYSPSTDHTTSSSLVSHSHKPLDAANDLHVPPESDRLPQVPQNEARTRRKRSGRKKRTITSTNKRSRKRPSLPSQAKVNKELKEGDSLSLEGGSEGVSVKLSEDHLYSPSTDHTTSSSLVSHSHKPLDAASDLPPESDHLPQVPQNEARTHKKRSSRKRTIGMYTVNCVIILTVLTIFGKETVCNSVNSAWLNLKLP